MLAVEHLAAEVVGGVKCGTTLRVVKLRLAAPASDRLFIVEQWGKTCSFPNRPDATKADLVVDLHFDGLDWQPYAYAWNNEQTDAALVGSEGAERVFEVVDPHAPGGKRQQTWRFSGRAECQRRHNKWSGPPLAFNTLQLNKEHDYAGAAASQLETLAHRRLLDKPIPREGRPQLSDPRDSSAALKLAPAPICT